jgi:hypothetical protein
LEIGNLSKLLIRIYFTTCFKKIDFKLNNKLCNTIYVIFIMVYDLKYIHRKRGKKIHTDII